MKHRSRKSKSSERSRPNPKEPPQPPSAALGPARKWWFRMTALVVLPLLLIGGIEAALRLAGCGYPTDFFEKSASAERIIWSTTRVSA